MTPYQAIKKLQTHLNSSVLGQEDLVASLFIALLADGHLLVEGVPGLAKTSVIKALASGLEGSFHRIQFTPDLLPADITGTEVFRPDEGNFRFHKGPIFHNFILADEINRSPAKAQSALLEAMGERQVTVGRTTYPLEKLFLVMATQNPIEQEGTYSLPESQRDRFLLHTKVNYPDSEHERAILRLVRERARQGRELTEAPEEIVSQEIIFKARKEILSLHLVPELENYMAQLVIATRTQKTIDKELSKWLAFGASPRGTIALDRASRAYAWLSGRDYVSPEDIQAVAHDALRHRLILNYEAEADGVGPDDVISRLLQLVAVP